MIQASQLHKFLFWSTSLCLLKIVYSAGDLSKDAQYQRQLSPISLMLCPSQWMLVRGWIQLTFGFKTEVGSLHKSCTTPCRHKSFINVTWICLPCVSHCTEEMYTKRCHFLRLKGKRQQAWVSIDRNQTVGNRLTNSRYHTNCKWNSSPLSCMSETYMKLIHAIFPEFSVVGGGLVLFQRMNYQSMPECMTHFVNALHAVYDIWP